MNTNHSPLISQSNRNEWLLSYEINDQDLRNQTGTTHIFYLPNREITFRGNAATDLTEENFSSIEGIEGFSSKIFDPLGFLKANISNYLHRETAPIKKFQISDDLAQKIQCIVLKKLDVRAEDNRLIDEKEWLLSYYIHDGELRGYACANRLFYLPNRNVIFRACSDKNSNDSSSLSLTKIEAIIAQIFDPIDFLQRNICNNTHIYFGAPPIRKSQISRELAEKIQYIAVEELWLGKKYPNCESFEEEPIEREITTYSGADYDESSDLSEIVDLPLNDENSIDNEYKNSPITDGADIHLLSESEKSSDNEDVHELFEDEERFNEFLLKATSGIPYQTMVKYREVKDKLKKVKLEIGELFKTYADEERINLLD